MKQKYIDLFYKDIVIDLWNNSIEDYYKLLIDKASQYVTSEKDLNELIDRTLKKILSNLKNNVDIEIYDNVITRV